MTDQAPFPPTSQAGLSDNAAGGLAYFTFIPAIIFLVLEPFNRSSFIRFHAWQSLLLSASVFVINIALSILGRIPLVMFIDLFLYPLVWLGFFILWLIVLINAFNGKRFKVPVLGADVARVAVEAGVEVSWDRYLGFDGRFVGMHEFGASGKIGDVYKKFNITTESVVRAAREALATTHGGR